ncbi:MAG: hypothetical protein LUH09_03815 [Clostridiales bacterium]|nr:hypothetical protein [Clostridiales bacterium]
MREAQAFTDMRERLSRYTLALSKTEWLSARLAASSEPEEREELQHRVDMQRGKSRRIMLEILDQIDALSDTKQIEVLSLRFVDGLSMEAIADKLSYSERHVRRLYSDAINELIELETSRATS